MRVEAYAVGGETRHIQSAYFTFIAPDGTGNLKQLPKIAASSKVRTFLIDTSRINLL